MSRNNNHTIINLERKIDKLADEMKSVIKEVLAMRSIMEARFPAPHSSEHYGK